MVRLDHYTGRLGNRLFEIAAVIGCALINNVGYSLPIENDIQRLNIPEEKFEAAFDCNHLYVNNKFDFLSIEYRGVVRVTGFFHNEKYFIKHEDEVRKLLTPKGETEKIDATSLHVRRGDFLRYPKVLRTLDMSYYNKALGKINPNKVLIFSEDIAWCKENFKGEHFEFSEGKTPLEDLLLMSRCKNHVIANSTFSWWGAWLNPDPEKVIIAPEIWFNDRNREVREKGMDMHFKNFIKI